MFEIGNWIRREGQDAGEDDSPAKWHLVESVVAGDAITRCGRRMMPDVAGDALQVSAVKPLTRMIDQPQLCKAGCDA